MCCVARATHLPTPHALTPTMPHLNPQSKPKFDHEKCRCITPMGDVSVCAAAPPSANTNDVLVRINTMLQKDAETQMTSKFVNEFEKLRVQLYACKSKSSDPKLHEVYKIVCGMSNQMFNFYGLHAHLEMTRNTAHDLESRLRWMQQIMVDLDTLKTFSRVWADCYEQHQRELDLQKMEPVIEAKLKEAMAELGLKP